MTGRSTPPPRGIRRIAPIAFAALALGSAGARADGGDPATAEQALHLSAQGHGSVSISYQHSAVDGLRTRDSTVLDVGQGTLRALQLDLEYFLTDRWSLRAGIPFVSNVFHGSPHCPTAAPPQCRAAPRLNPPHPESAFRDDDRFHGTWQDWNLGLAWHGELGDGYLLTPSLAVYAPSHDYVFFSNAAPGPGYWRVEAGAELAHQFDFSNLYYRLNYTYAYTEQVLDTRMNHHRVSAELGYFVNERLSLRAFASGKRGEGYTIQELGPLTAGRTNAYWYHHDQIVVHDFADAGLGADYRFGGRYTVSAAWHTMIWGRSVNNFRYAAELRLSRDF